MFLTVPGLGAIRKPPNGIPLIVGDREAHYLTSNDLATVVIEFEESSVDIQEKLLDFFNNALPTDISSVKGIGAKKIEEILQSRPFTWEQLQNVVSERVLDSVKSSLFN